MDKRTILSVLFVLFLLVFPWHLPVADQHYKTRTLAAESISMDHRQFNPRMNDIDRDNILLTLSYFNDASKKNEPLNWDEIRRPKIIEWTLPAGKTFAFHDAVLPEFQSTLIKTTGAHFGGDEGFKNDGYLMGNGVCHLASLMNWVAKEAHLKTVAPTNHNFAVIPGIARQHGVAIYTDLISPSSSANQNLYITNVSSHDITFTFRYDGHDLSLSASETI